MMIQDELTGLAELLREADADRARRERMHAYGVEAEQARRAQSEK